MLSSIIASSKIVFNFSPYANTKVLSTLGPTINRWSSSDSKFERIVITDDSSTIVCWHPEKPFPYECSRPIPEDVVKETNSVLKVQSLTEVFDIFKPKSEGQTREELMKITYSTKHIWFPRGKKTYKRKPWPKNREYL